MRQFPVKANPHITMARIRPSYADVLCGLVDDPVIGRFLLEPPALTGKRVRSHHDRDAMTPARMVSWLERHDPLFGATLSLLFEVTESWPTKMERAYWREVEGNPMKFLDIYSDVRALAEDGLFPPEGRCGKNAGEAMS